MLVKSSGFGPSEGAGGFSLLNEVPQFNAALAAGLSFCLSNSFVARCKSVPLYVGEQGREDGFTFRR